MQIRDDSTAVGVVSRETHERLKQFEILLEHWNRRINLVAKADLTQLWRRHIIDSLQLIPLLRPSVETCLDIGTGAGFPGLILAIATGRHFHLVEADQRKAAFLQEASRATGAHTTVHAMRVERLNLPSVDLVTARAVAPLVTLLELATPLLTPGGKCVFLKGRTAEQELVEARRVWHMTSERQISRTDPDGCVLELSEIARVECSA